MKSTKNILASLVILCTLSSFGLINHPELIKSKTEVVVKSDSLQKLQAGKVSTQAAIKALPEKDEFNKQKEEEQASKGSFFNQLSYFILLGFKTLVKLALKLYTL